MASLPDWRARLGGRWLVSWQAYAIGTPIAFITVTWFGADQAPAGTSGFAIAGWAGVVASACAVVGALMLLAHLTVLRRRTIDPVPFPLALAFLALLGIAFALVLIVGAPIVGAPRIESPGFTIVVMAVISAWWGAVLVLTLDARERITLERVAVLNAAVDQELTNVQQTDVSRILREFLDTRVNTEFQSVRDTLEAELLRVESDARTGGWIRVSEELRLTARASVRQLSAELWAMAETAYPKVTAWTMVPAIIRTQPLRPWAVALLVLLVTAQNTIDRLGMPWGAVAVLVGSAGVYAVLALANALMGTFPRQHAAIFVGTMVLITLGGAATTAASGGEVSLMATVFNFGITAILLISTSAFGAVYRANSQMITALTTRVDREAIDNVVRQRELATIARQAASILHGQVQSRLVACASAIDRAAALKDDAALTQALEQARDILEQPLRLPDPPESLEAAIAGHREQWRGIIDVHLSPGPAVDLDPTTLHHLSVVVEEAIVNAFRHGEARRVEVQVDATSSDVLIIVKDDGSGPRRSWTAGTGSAMLTHISGGNWHLRERAEGGGVLEVRLQGARSHPVR